MSPQTHSDLKDLAGDRGKAATVGLPASANPSGFGFRPPKQGRSQQTLDRITSAALELMEASGVEATTVAAIVARAGSSVGSFYARFPGKEDLVRFLQTRVWTEARERWDRALASQAWDGLRMAVVVESVVGLLLRSLRVDRQRRRILGRNRVLDPEAADFVLSFHEHIISTVTALLLERRGEITHPDPEAAVRFGYRVVVGAIREFMEMEEARMLSGSPSAPQDPVLELGPELSRLWVGYLDPSRGDGESAEEGGVDFFDPWG